MSILVLFLLSILGSNPAHAAPETQKDALYFSTLQEDLDWFQAGESQFSPRDTQGLFFRVYHSVTEEMSSMFAEKQFQNLEWVNRLMLKYVSLYRNALDCSTSGECAVSPAWQTAFGANRKDSKPASIQLLLSISAHVNRDLPIALAEIDTDFGNASMHSDFQQISQIFQRKMPELIGLVQEYQSCRVNSADRKLINDIILWAMGRTREKSWNYGARLAKVQSADEESALLQEIERHTKQEDLSIDLFAPAPELFICI